MNPFDRNRSALLLMDFQTPIVEMAGAQATVVLERAAALAAQARAARIPIVYVVVGFRPGYPEFSTRNPAYARITGSNNFTGAPGADLVASLRPELGEVVVVKHRVGAFAGSDLEMVLRAKSVDTLILAGIATGGVVLSTLRHAADADYQIVVASDACLDRDEETHRVLIEKVFPRQASVGTASEICAAMGAAS